MTLGASLLDRHPPGLPDDSSSVGLIPSPPVTVIIVAGSITAVGPITAVDSIITAAGSIIATGSTTAATMRRSAGSRGSTHRHNLAPEPTGSYVYASDDAGRDAFRTGARQFDHVLAAGAPGEPLVALLERVADLDYEWGTSDGN
jgi:hypothetical protein